MDNKALSEGISFTSKRKWDKDSEKVEENSNPEPDEQTEAPKKDIQQLLRQQYLGERLNQAKTINYSGFAVNGGSIFFILYGAHELALDANTIEAVALFNETFGTDFNYSKFVEIIEDWKVHLTTLAGSIQTFFMWYQSMRQKMKDLDTPKSFLSFVNKEFGEIV